jgi:hypothetical protein
MITVEVKTLAVTTLVGLAHIVSGLTAFLVPAALYVTPLAGFADLTRYFGVEDHFACAILIAVGVLAVFASQTAFAYRVLLLMPQQVLLLIQIWSITVALSTGAYPDGYIPTGGGAFILNDQIWPWLLTIAHSAWLAAFIWQGVRDGGEVL